MNFNAGQPANSANTAYLKHSYVNPYTSTRVDWINLSLNNDITACQAQCCLGCTEGDPKCVVTNAKNAFCGRARTNLSGPHYFCFDNYGTTYKSYKPFLIYGLTLVVLKQLVNHIIVE